MRVMLLGAGGMLGSDLMATAPGAVSVLPFTHASLDITDAEALAHHVAAARPDVIVNAAGYTAVDRAESEPEAAFRVNAAAVGELGRMAERAGARVVHFSTDYVFDGTAREPYTEEASTNPVNTYGASKRAGERELLGGATDVLIVRTQWLFGTRGRSFPATMLARARAGLPTKVVSDQQGRPTYTVDLAGAVWAMIMAGLSGIYHVANSGIATWFDVASCVFRAAGHPELASPCTTAEYPTAARRPLRSCLSTAKVEATLGRRLPHWEDAITRYLEAVLSGVQRSPS